MARRCDSEKHAEWGKRLGRFSRCGVTVGRFCSGERVSVASFYYWRKKLGLTSSGRRTRSRPGFFRQVTVAAAPPAMTPGTPAVIRDTPAVDPAASAKVPAACTVSIQLPCGTRIELGAEHVDAVRAVVGEVARAGRGLKAGAAHDLQAGAAPC